MRSLLRPLVNVTTYRRWTVVTVETVKTHAGNVLGKLGCRDGTQAVIVAYESGFVART